MITFNFQIIDSHIRLLDSLGYAILSFSCIFGSINVKLICHGSLKNHLTFQGDLSTAGSTFKNPLREKKNCRHRGLTPLDRSVQEWLVKAGGFCWPMKP